MEGGKKFWGHPSSVEGAVLGRIYLEFKKKCEEGVNVCELKLCLWTEFKT